MAGSASDDCQSLFCAQWNTNQRRCTLLTRQSGVVQSYDVINTTGSGPVKIIGLYSSVLCCKLRRNTNSMHVTTTKPPYYSCGKE